MLASRDPETAYPVASATKLMTYLVAAEELRPAREIVVAPYDPKPGESRAGFVPGAAVSVRDALYGLMVPSGNDAALTLALAVAGSESDFVSRMNEAASDLGLDETSYLDPIGLNAGNVSSARDLVDLASELREQELFREIVDTPQTTLRSADDPLRIENRNALVLEEPFVDGIKTGTTVEAGYVLVASGKRKGVSLISVVLASPDEASRDSATLDLLEYGFSLYGSRALVEKGERLGSAPLAEGGRLPLLAAAELSEVARADQKVEVKLAPLAPVEAPISEGDQVGVARVSLDGEPVGKVEAVAARTVAGLPEQEEAARGGLPTWAWIIFAGATVVSVVLGLLAAGVHRRE